jgi:hypothetical protein
MAGGSEVETLELASRWTRASLGWPVAGIAWISRHYLGRDGVVGDLIASREAPVARSEAIVGLLVSHPRVEISSIVVGISPVKRASEGGVRSERAAMGRRRADSGRKAMAIDRRA